MYTETDSGVVELAQHVQHAIRALRGEVNETRPMGRSSRADVTAHYNRLMGMLQAYAYVAHLFYAPEGRTWIEMVAESLDFPELPLILHNAYNYHR
jgi:hypothetical protein